MDISDDSRNGGQPGQGNVTIEITKESPNKNGNNSETEEKEENNEAQDTVTDYIQPNEAAANSDSNNNQSQTDVESDQSSSQNNSAKQSTRKSKKLLPKLKNNKLRPLNSIKETSTVQESSSNNASDTSNNVDGGDNSDSKSGSKKTKFYKRSKKWDKSTKLSKSNVATTSAIENNNNSGRDESASSNHKRSKKITDEPSTITKRSATTNGSARPKTSKIIFAVSNTPGESIIPIESNIDKISVKNSEHGNVSSKLHFEVMWKDLIYYHASVIKARKKNISPKETQKKQAKSKSNASSAVSKNSTIVESTTNNRKPELPSRAKGGPILSNISGSFCSGQLTALMGPSGAGKTVLLNCIAGFLPINSLKENSGEILINGVQSIRIGFVEQFDHLLPNLTVRETLHFASRIRNASRFYLNHDKIIKNIMKQLDLKDIAETFASQCSNGQRKRLSIAIELVFNSDILILDEPTTGLDTVTGFQIIKTLQNLSRRRQGISIVTTIHQPSSTMFEQFDNLIVLSGEGTIIYQGSPSELPNTLKLVGLECPKFYNLSDYMLEVASGDFGRQSLHLLTHYNRESNRVKNGEDWNELEMCSLNEAVRKAQKVNRRSFMLCTWLLLIRTIICNYRNSFINYTRLITSIATSLFFGVMFTDVVGSISSCPPTKYFLWNIKMADVYDTFESQQLHLRENISVIFMAVLVSFFNSMLKIVVTFPAEVFVFRRENNNFSYHTMSYFIAIILGDIPFDIPITTLFVVIIHRLTGQIFNQWDRLYMAVLPCCLTTIIGQLIGMIMSVMFYKNAIAAIYSINIVLIPMILYSGFFKMISEMSTIMAMLSNVSFMKSALNGMMIAIYGLGRCRLERLEGEAQFALQNCTKLFTEPRWIGSLSTLIDYQLMLTTSDDPVFMKLKNGTIEKEEKLALYMGLDTSDLNPDRPMVLQHFALGYDYSAYWHEMCNLLKYIVMYLVILYITISFKIRRQRN